MALCVGLAAVALVTSVVGMARASRPRFAGGLLASLGLVLALATPRPGRAALHRHRHRLRRRLRADAAGLARSLNGLLPTPDRPSDRRAARSSPASRTTSTRWPPRCARAVEEVRAIVHEAVPEGEEAISYNMPTVAIATVARSCTTPGGRSTSASTPFPTRAEPDLATRARAVRRRQGNPEVPARPASAARARRPGGAAAQRRRAVSSRYSHSIEPPAAPYRSARASRSRSSAATALRVGRVGLVDRDRRAVARLEELAELAGRGEPVDAQRADGSARRPRPGRRRARARGPPSPTAAAAARREAAAGRRASWWRTSGR